MTSTTSNPTASSPSASGPKALLEHVNITVRDPQATADLLGRLFGWDVRWSGSSELGGRSVHVGSDGQYLAVYSEDPASPLAENSYAVAGGLNHVGVVVEDLDATEALVLAEGIKTYSHDDYDPGRRFYFNDADGIEYEVVSYT